MAVMAKTCEQCTDANQVCVWTEDENGPYETTCGNAFVFEEDGPIYNGFKFCPYCGMAMKEQPVSGRRRK